MSKHSTLKATGTVGGKRSVLKRFERVKLMKERGQWKEGQSPIGLPKTKFEAYFSPSREGTHIFWSPRLWQPRGFFYHYTFREIYHV